MATYTFNGLNDENLAARRVELEQVKQQYEEDLRLTNVAIDSTIAEIDALDRERAKRIEAKMKAHNDELKKLQKERDQLDAKPKRSLVRAPKKPDTAPDASTPLRPKPDRRRHTD